MVLNETFRFSMKNELLASLSTFKIGGNADNLVIPKFKEELIETLKAIDIHKDNYIILGSASNVLISSQGFRGTVIITKDLNKISLDDDTILMAESGVKLPRLAGFCKENHLSGMEFLIAIPGSVGGAVYMNCSAHNQWISDTIIDAEIFDMRTKRSVTKTKEDLELTYRHSAIDPDLDVVVSARFKLNKSTPNSIDEKITTITEYRKARQPKGFNAGSIFKNPDTKVSAGYLLDSVGAKGWQEGGAEVTTIHANFINNIDNATSLDVSRLMLRMHNEVKAKTGYKLYPEIKYVGEPTEEEEKIWKILLEN